MIDKVRMNCIIDIPAERLVRPDWRTYKEYRIHRYEGLWIIYKPLTRRLTISGRLTTISVRPDRVTNMDAFYGGVADLQVRQVRREDGSVSYLLVPFIQNLSDLVDLVNERLLEVTGVDLDVTQFNVTYVEVCFNTKTDHVPQYVEAMNHTFTAKNPVMYRNYVVEKGLCLGSSFYVKSRKDFENRTRYRYVINFYNKADQLQFMLRKSLPIYHLNRFNVEVPFTTDDFERARNILRLEVQIGYRALIDLFGGRPHLFIDFFNMDFCRSVIEDRYNHMVGRPGADFCSYTEARARVIAADLLRPTAKALIHYLRDLAQNHQIEKNRHARHRKILNQLGIHWYLIPTGWGIPCLPSPIRLLDETIAQIREDVTTMEWRRRAAEAEAEMYNNIEITDD
jgi:hypothetical protein